MKTIPLGHFLVSVVVRNLLVDMVKFVKPTKKHTERVATVVCHVAHIAVQAVSFTIIRAPYVH